MTNENNTIIRDKDHRVLQVKDLVVSFKTDRGIVHAVRGVSFDLYKGETLCIVGESGSGKSVTNKAIIGISAANAIIEQGSIMYEGEDLVRVSEEEFHRIRGHKIGMIFQDPLSALNPVMKVGKQIIEATMINKNILKKHYNELIAKEHVKFNNEITNFLYDQDKIEKEVEKLENLNKSYKKASSALENCKNDEKKDEFEANKNKVFEEVKTLINDTKVFINTEVERLNERVGHYERKWAKKDEFTELKKEIAEVELATTTSVRDLYLAHHNEADKISSDDVNFLTFRIKFLKEYRNLLKANHKKLSPLLKKDLNVRKKEAKAENKTYANQLKKEHEEKITQLNEELNIVKEKISNFENSLSDEERNHVHEILLSNKKKLIKKQKLELKNREVNVSKTHKDSSLELEKLPYEELQNLYDSVDEVNNHIKEEKRRYINQTKITKAEAKRMALEVMKEVGIPLPERRFKQYPFEFSGGMRQRIVIAIALTANPEILICDEPTTALDVTIQAQILELINKLKRERHLSCIFITHDLGVVANMADRVAVMYAGKIVEYGLANEVFFDPRHPYTWALLSSVPDVDSKEKLEAIPGTPPDMLYPPEGDAFALRSKYAMAIDFKYQPPYFKVSDTHFAATWLLYPGAPKVEMPKIVKTRIENSLKEEQERLNREKEKEEIIHE